MKLSGSQIYTGLNPTTREFEIRFIKDNQTMTVEVDNVNRLDMLIGQLQVLRGMMNVGSNRGNSD